MSVETVAHPDSESLFTVTFNNTDTISTTVTSSPSTVTAWVSAALSNNVSLIGLDCEWRPSKSSSVQFPVATLQLCTDHSCLIYQLLYRPDSSSPHPSSLTDLLTNPQIKFAGVGIEEDMERLLLDHDISVKGLVDLRDLAGDKMGEGRRRELRQMGLAGLARELMGVEMKKPQRVRMGRWDQEYLTYDQIGYACVDAFLSFEIGRRLFAM